MKKLVILLALIAFPASAQNVKTVINVIQSYTTDYVTGGGTRLDGPVPSNISGIRVTCTTACYIALSTGYDAASNSGTNAGPFATNSRLQATKLTGIYLPAAEPMLIGTIGGVQVEVSPAATAGTISVDSF